MEIRSQVKESFSLNNFTIGIFWDEKYWYILEGTFPIIIIPLQEAKLYFLSSSSILKSFAVKAKRKLHFLSVSSFSIPLI